LRKKLNSGFGYYNSEVVNRIGKHVRPSEIASWLKLKLKRKEKRTMVYVPSVTDGGLLRENIKLNGCQETETLVTIAKRVASETLISSCTNCL
jgi:hypothetical protein